MVRNRRWAQVAAALAIFLSGLLAGRLLRPSVLPVETERRLLAGQMGLDLHRLHLGHLRVPASPEWREWAYDPPCRTPTGCAMLVDTRCSRVEFAEFMVCHPLIGRSATWGSPVALEATSGCRILRSYTLPAGPAAPRVQQAVADLAVVATAAVLGLSAADREGRTFAPRLDWTDAATVPPGEGHYVRVELRFERPGRAAPRVVECTVIPETRQVSKVSVRW